MNGHTFNISININPSDGDTTVIGVRNTIIIPSIDYRTKELLIRAVNNRTRERNYFRLYSQLLENEISDDFFDNEIERNGDDYVVSTDKDADLEDVKIAINLCNELKDVATMNEMADLFSFKGESLNTILENHNNQMLESH